MVVGRVQIVDAGVDFVDPIIALDEVVEISIVAVKDTNVAAEMNVVVEAVFGIGTDFGAEEWDGNDVGVKMNAAEGIVIAGVARGVVKLA